MIGCQERNCKRKLKVAQNYVMMVADVYEDKETVMRSAVGVKDGLKVGVGLHQ